MKKKYLLWAVIIFLITAFIVPLIISEAFKIKGYNTSWEASDSLAFYGTYISAAGTIALSAVALWQNYLFKVENDKAQFRLENINKQANEINLISKIIEHEELRLQDLRESFNKFYDICDPVYILSEIKEKSPEETSYFLINLLKELDIKSKRLFNCLSWNTNDDREFKHSIVTLQTLTTKMIKELYKNGYSDIGQDVFDKRFEFEDVFDEYYMNYQTKLESVLYSKITLEEVYQIYNRDEDENNGQA